MLFNPWQRIEAEEKNVIEMAEQGDAPAQFNLGNRYLFSKKGVGRNFKLAFSLLTDSAHSEYVVAQYNLGRLYPHGLGTDKDLEQASRRFRLAADAGYLRIFRPGSNWRH